MCKGPFKQPKIPKMEAPKADDAAVRAAQEAELLRARNAKGRASTLLTSAQGDTSTANSAVKTLLGD